MLYTDKVNNRLTPELLAADESAYKVANGYIEMSGSFEEGYPRGYESRRSTKIKGLDQVMAVADLQTVRLWLGDSEFSLFEGKVRTYERSMDIQKGFSIRKIIWTSPNGHSIRLTVRRMASFEKPELLVIDYQIQSIDYSGPVRIQSDVVQSREDGKNFQIRNVHKEDDLVLITGISSDAECKFTAAASYSLPMTHTVGKEGIRSFYEGILNKGDLLRLEKYCIYTDSGHHGHMEQVAHSYMKEVRSQGADVWFKAQKDYMTSFWRAAKVEMMGDRVLEEAVNGSVYHALVSGGTSPIEGSETARTFEIDKTDGTNGLTAYHRAWLERFNRYLAGREKSSPGIQGIQAVQNGEIEFAMDCLKQSLEKCSGDAFMLVLYGFGGVRLNEDGLHLNPVCPKAWEGYSFRIRYKGADLKVLVEQDLVITASKPIEVWLYEQKYIINKALYLPLKTDRSSD